MLINVNFATFLKGFHPILDDIPLLYLRLMLDAFGALGYGVYDRTACARA